jgi:hypothetical protein
MLTCCSAQLAQGGSHRDAGATQPCPACLTHRTCERLPLLSRSKLRKLCCTLTRKKCRLVCGRFCVSEGGRGHQGLPAPGPWQSDMADVAMRPGVSCLAQSAAQTRVSSPHLGMLQPAYRWNSSKFRVRVAFWSKARTIWSTWLCGVHVCMCAFVCMCVFVRARARSHACARMHVYVDVLLWGEATTSDDDASTNRTSEYVKFRLPRPRARCSSLASRWPLPSVSMDVNHCRGVEQAAHVIEGQGR